ncbi:MAG: hypothetical protein NT026_01270 [Candidatus Staskawiczbacteria bacterium]|nr:hypothetical protein [Candidatus Staskawiczbacteria bacterium]
MFFSFLPDLGQIPFYIFLGWKNARPFFFPLNSDWNGARALYPFLTALWDIPHSFFFAFLIILPIILFFKLPKISFFAYLLHLIIDIPTHSGEWAVKPFYPINYTFGGATNAWALPIWAMIIFWIIFLLIIIFLKKINDRSFNKN